jgi:hypothetical protein
VAAQCAARAAAGENLMSTRILLADGDSQQTIRRLEHFRKHGLATLSGTGGDDALFASFLEPGAPTERILVLVHLTAWPMTAPPVSEWHAERKERVTLLLYSFGNWLHPIEEPSASYVRMLPVNTYVLQRPVEMLSIVDFAGLADFAGAWETLSGRNELQQILDGVNNLNKLDYVPALALMAQAHLAAHGKIELPEGVAQRIPAAAAEATAEPAWWSAVFGTEADFRNAVKNELAVITRGRKADVPPEIGRLADRIFRARTRKVDVEVVEPVLRWLKDYVPVRTARNEQ